MVQSKIQISALALCLCCLMAGGCGKKDSPTSPPTNGTTTGISGLVTDSLGNALDSVGIAIKYFFAPTTKGLAKDSACSLEYFTASRITNGARLEWATYWENNAYQWHIERSLVSDTGYATVGSIPGQGTSSIPHQYQFVDTPLVVSQSYFYRLDLVDLDGFHEFFGPIGLGPGPLVYTDGLAGGCPNPFTGTTSIGFSVACSSHVVLEIYQNNNSIRTLIGNDLQPGNHVVIWNGGASNGNPVPSGYYTAKCTITRHDSTIILMKPLFVNIVDQGTTRRNCYSNSQGAFSVSDMPVDSVFTSYDENGVEQGAVKVCDSIVVYAVKNGYQYRAIPVKLSKNAGTTVTIILYQ
jgi:hypothetical protein